MQKILPILLLMVLVTINVWSFDVKSSLNTIKSKEDQMTLPSQNSIYKEYTEDDISYAKLNDYPQYMYTNNTTNDVEWWFTYKLDGANVADIVLDFSFTSECAPGETKNTGLSIYLPNGDTYNGTVSDIPCDEPSGILVMQVTIKEDSSKGTLTYDADKKTFTIAAADDN